MNYIYDIILNFQQPFYDFYEWKKEDKLTIIKKIPVFRIAPSLMRLMHTTSFTISPSFYKMIQHKTITSSNKIIDAALFITNDCCLAVIFNFLGEMISLSSLYLDEEIDLLTINNIKKINLTIKINYQKKITFLTRLEKERLDYLKMKIEKMVIDKEYDKLNYLYYECFFRKPVNKEKIIQEIKNELSSSWNETGQKIYDFFQLISNKKT